MTVDGATIYAKARFAFHCALDAQGFPYLQCGSQADLGSIVTTVSNSRHKIMPLGQNVDLTPGVSGSGRLRFGRLFNLPT